MDSTVLKYNLLSPFEKKEVGDFIDFLFSKHKKSTQSEFADYKKKILSVSVWDEKDVNIFEENRKNINQWQPPTW